jgi:hypothetical protein
MRETSTGTSTRKRAPWTRSKSSKPLMTERLLNSIQHARTILSKPSLPMSEPPFECLASSSPRNAREAGSLQFLFDCIPLILPPSVDHVPIGADVDQPVGIVLHTANFTARDQWQNILHRLPDILWFSSEHEEFPAVSRTFRQGRQLQDLLKFTSPVPIAIDPAEPCPVAIVEHPHFAEIIRGLTQPRLFVLEKP